MVSFDAPGSVRGRSNSRRRDDSPNQLLKAFCEPVICIRQWLVAVKPHLHDDKKLRRKPRVSLAFFFPYSHNFPSLAVVRH